MSEFKARARKKYVGRIFIVTEMLFPDDHALHCYDVADKDKKEEYFWTRSVVKVSKEETIIECL